MTTQEKLIAKYGNPMKSAADKLTFEKKFMGVYVYPEAIRKAIPAIGDRLYCNRDFWNAYLRFLNLLIERGLHTEIHSNDECFIPRYQRGSSTQISIHTWGMAVDLNPADNPIGFNRDQCKAKGLRPFTPEFIQAGRDSGLVCGYDFGPNRCDGMHFENTKGL